MFKSHSPPTMDDLLVAQDLRELLTHVSDGAMVVDASRRIVFWNSAATDITGLRPEDVIGRRCADDLLMHVDAEGHSRCDCNCPLQRCLDGAGPQRARLHVRHDQGHRLPVRVRAVPVRNARGTLQGAVELFTDLSLELETVARMAELERMAYVDPLTRVANRRFLEQHVVARLHELRRFGWQFGAVLLDIDRFKCVNDGHGHAAGDQMLTMVAQTLAATARPFDLVARWGGDEFVHVVGHASASAVREVAERIGQRVRSAQLAVDDSNVGVTVSIGTALARPSDTPNSLLERADRGLYASKHRGGDCIHAGEEVPAARAGRPPWGRRPRGSSGHSGYGGP